MTIENRVNAVESQVENLDSAMVNLSDRLDQMDDGNLTVQNFVVAQRKNDDHLDLLNDIGLKISNKINSTTNVNYPSGIQVYEPGKPLVISYYQRLIRYTEDFTIDKIFSADYQNPKSSNDGIAYSIGFAVDVEGEGNFAICSYARHICRVYDKEGTLLFTIGTSAAAGKVEDNKLYNPSKSYFLPNGNILIVNYQGVGKDATNNGHVSEYSGVDGSFIATRLGFYGNGQSEIGTNKIYQPMGLDVDKTDDNLLWISEYGRSRVLVVNRTTWLVEDIYYPPTDYSFGRSYGIACLSDGNFAIASNTQASIMVIDRTTKSVIKELDVSSVGASPDFRDVKELKPGFLIFTSWVSRGVFVIPIDNTTEISYDQPPLPADSTLIEDVQFPGYDTETGTLTRNTNSLSDVPQKIAVPYKNRFHNNA